jgi:DNA-binding response OmpR family regulator
MEEKISEMNENLAESVWSLAPADKKEDSLGSASQSQESVETLVLPLWLLTDKSDSKKLYREILGSEYDIELFATAPAVLARLQSPATRAPYPQILIVDLEPPAQPLADLLLHQKQQDSRYPFPILLISSARDILNLRESLNQGDYSPIHDTTAKATLSTELIIDPVSLTILRDQRSSPPLTSKEFQIVALFKESSELTASRNDIISRVWKDVHVSSKTLDVHLFNLRKKLNPLGLELRFRAPHYYTLLSTERAPKS